MSDLIDRDYMLSQIEKAKPKTDLLIMIVL